MQTEHTGECAGESERTPQVEVSKRLVFINSASSILAYGLQISVLVWLQQYLLKRISVEEYSLFPLVAAIMVFVPLLTNAAVSGLARFTVDAYARGDERRVTQIVSTMTPVVCAAASLVLVAGFLCVWQVDHLLEIQPNRTSDARLMLGLLMLLATIRVATAPFTLGPYIRQKFVLLNVIQLATQLLRLLILLCLLFGVSTRVLWVVVASTSAETCGVMVTVAVSRHLVPALRFRRDSIRWGTARELISFSVWTFLLDVAAVIRQGADPLILNRLATALDVTCCHLGSLAVLQIRNMTIRALAPVQPASDCGLCEGRDG